MPAPVTFSTFVISLAHSALGQLGEQAQGKADRDLATHTLELLDLLADKTRGNLDQEEGHLLNTVRAEIRAKLG